MTALVGYEAVRRLAVISFHTSPLQQPGIGDSGGMNVYVRELVSSLAQAGVACDVYTRTWADDLAEEVIVEPGFRVVHIDAGPTEEVEKSDLLALLPVFTRGVIDHIRETGKADAVHAHYWLSGIVGHSVKHELGLPLISTFHTLARVKAELSGPEP
ncbi:MAG: glycosyltransferase, partial [Acidimicrobiales bacterium]